MGVYASTMGAVKADTGQRTSPYRRHNIAALPACAGCFLLSLGCSLLIVFTYAVNRPPFYILGVLSILLYAIDSG